MKKIISIILLLFSMNSNSSENYGLVLATGMVVSSSVIAKFIYLIRSNEKSYEIIGNIYENPELLENK